MMKYVQPTQFSEFPANFSPSLRVERDKEVADRMKGSRMYQTRLFFDVYRGEVITLVGNICCSDQSCRDELCCSLYVMPKCRRIPRDGGSLCGGGHRNYPEMLVIVRISGKLRRYFSRLKQSHAKHFALKMGIMPIFSGVLEC
jgi:hypothetical protein